MSAPRENDISKVILDAAILVHRELGPGLLESVYEMALAHELTSRGLSVERQVPIRATYRGVDLGEAFRADLIVDDLVIIELKSLKKLDPVHAKQALTYARLSNKRLALLINFGAHLVKDGFERVVNGLPD